MTNRRYLIINVGIVGVLLALFIALILYVGIDRFVFNNIQYHTGVMGDSAGSETPFRISSEIPHGQPWLSYMLLALSTRLYLFFSTYSSIFPILLIFMAGALALFFLKASGQNMEHQKMKVTCYIGMTAFATAIMPFVFRPRPDDMLIITFPPAAIFSAVVFGKLMNSLATAGKRGLAAITTIVLLIFCALAYLPPDRERIGLVITENGVKW